MDNNDSNPISPYIRPIVTFLVVLVFLSMISLGREVPEIFWYIVVGVMTFWFGERFIEKYASSVKNGSISAPEIKQTISEAVEKALPPKADNGGNGDSQLPPEPPIGPIPFSEAEFRADVTANVEKDRSIVNPSTILFEARDTIAYRWYEAGKINNNVAHKGMLEVILDLAKKAMAYEWSKPLGKDPTPEFNEDPIKYVNDHFAEFRNCPSCKDKTDQLVDIDWLARQLTETATYVSLDGVRDAQEQYDMTVQAIKDNGLITWET
uniref:Uncharacterized protein n=1 Tax=viral metagenome TaxID=1070528 RepID=A0A6M3IPV7_9ZZZZ